MTYYKLGKGKNSRWTAQPETAEELQYTLNMETPWLDHNPNEVPEASDELLDMFL